MEVISDMLDPNDSQLPAGCLIYALHSAFCALTACFTHLVNQGFIMFPCLDSSRYVSCISTELLRKILAYKYMEYSATTIDNGSLRENLTQ